METKFIKYLKESTEMNFQEMVDELVGKMTVNLLNSKFGNVKVQAAAIPTEENDIGEFYIKTNNFTATVKYKYKGKGEFALSLNYKTKFNGFNYLEDFKDFDTIKYTENIKEIISKKLNDIYDTLFKSASSKVKYTFGGNSVELDTSTLEFIVNELKSKPEVDITTIDSLKKEICISKKLPIGDADNIGLCPYNFMQDIKKAGFKQKELYYKFI